MRVFLSRLSKLHISFSVNNIVLIKTWRTEQSMVLHLNGIRRFI